MKNRTIRSAVYNQLGKNNKNKRKKNNPCNYKN